MLQAACIVLLDTPCQALLLWAVCPFRCTVFVSIPPSIVLAKQYAKSWCQHVCTLNQRHKELSRGLDLSWCRGLSMLV